MRFLRDLLRTDRFVLESPHEPAAVARRARDSGAAGRFRVGSMAVRGRATEQQIRLRCNPYVPKVFLVPVAVAKVRSETTGSRVSVRISAPRTWLTFWTLILAFCLYLGIGGLVETGNPVWLVIPPVAGTLFVALAAIDEASTRGDREVLRWVIEDIADARMDGGH